jgi:hypothetical protein
MVVVGSADSNGQTWVSSPFANVEVAAPMLTAKLSPAKVEQGQNVTLTADVTVKTKFDGKAKVELVGLPGNSTAPQREISADDTKLEFPVTTAKTTPAAQHKGLFLRVTVMKDGEPIVHNIGRGGLLRVEAPLAAKTDPKAKADPKAKGATTKPAAGATTKPTATPTKASK